VTQLGSPATESGPDGSARRPAARGSRLARRRRVLLGVGIAAALLAVGGLIGASFVKSPQQLAADTAAPPSTVTTAAVVSQVLTSSVEMRGVVYPATEYDVYPSAPSTSGSSGGGSPAGGSSAPVYISKLDVAAGRTVRNGEQLAELDGQPLFALTGTVPAWRDLTPGETGPDVAELQRALASLGYYDEGDTPGYFGPATEYAVSLYYEHLDYIPPSSGGVPAADVVFLPSLPATVVAVNGAAGQQPGQPFLELAARGSLTLTGELPPAYAGQVKPGLKVTIYDEVTGIRATGTVADPVIDLRGLARSYPGPPPVPALRPADLVIEAGDYVAVTGPSGSGKSTLLHLLGLLDAPTAGSYLLDSLDTSALNDRDRSALRGRRIGFVFQAFHLLPYRTALENVLLAQLYNQTPRGGRVEAAAGALHAVGLGHRLDALPTTLSGGECQRVAIARALVNRPSLLLCDEPTGNLDSRNAAALMELLDQLNAAGFTIVVITHDAGVAAHAGRAIGISDGVLSERRKAGHA